MVGFIKGGSRGSVPVCRDSVGTSIVFVYAANGGNVSKLKGPELLDR